MAEGRAGLAVARRARLWETIRRLDDDTLRARVEQSYKECERNIEAWHDFVENLELAMRVERIQGPVTTDRPRTMEKLAS